MALHNKTEEWEKALLDPDEVSLLARIKRHYALVLGIALFMAFAATFCALLSTPPARSAPTDVPSDETAGRTDWARAEPEPQRINDTLATFLFDWPNTVDKDRAAMARFFGFFKYEPALAVLRREAGTLTGPSAVASLQALGAMGDVDAIDLFRDVIRYSADCQAVEVAATTIGAWRDDLSYATLIDSLITPRCEGAAVVAQVRTLLRLKHPYLEEFLFLIHQVTTSDTARLAAAAALAPRAEGPRRHPVEATLRTALYSVDSSSELNLAIDEQTLLLALWGMGRFSTRTCNEAAEHALNTFKNALTERRQTTARIFLLSALPCFKPDRKKNKQLITDLLVAANDERITLEFINGNSGATLPLIEDQQVEAPWVDWLFQLATRFTLWDQTRSIAQFARAIERLEQLRTATEPNRPSANLTVASNITVPRPDFDQLESLAGDWEPAEDFDTYEYTPGQPDWWPAYIDLTVDDGPRPRRLTKILDSLDEWGVKATFFYIGVNVARNWSLRPEETTELLNRVLDSGHRIGYHSVTHDTSWFRHLQACTPEQILTDITLFNTTMVMALGMPWTGEYGRLPGGMGRYQRHVRFAFDEAGFKAPVHWHVQEPAWGPSSTSAELRALARKLVRAGKPTVILLHEYQGLHWQLNTFIKSVHREVEKMASETAS